MIAQLTGTVADISLTTVTINVGGVGYLVHATFPTTELTLESTLTLYTYLAVRENALDLYGFYTKDEERMFTALLSVPKIGPKSAQQILLQAELSVLQEAIGSEDASLLSKLSGIGKKTAEKIVSELKDSELVPETFVSAAYGSQGEVIEALVALGYAEKDAREAAKQLPAELGDTNAKIKAALQLLS
jgi:Holliday junction DNA helicase RuvA